MNDVTDPVSGEEKVRFSSGGSECAAWHWPGSDGSCVITASGFAVTKEPGTDPFARRFHDAGFGVLAFDCRGFGESGGRPRQVASVVVVCEQDQSASPTAAVRATRRAPRAELVWLPGGHCAPFLDAHERAVDAELSFLRRHVLDSPVASVASVERG